MPEAWDIVCMTDSHKIMELRAPCCLVPMSGNVAHCSVSCRVFYWVSGASLIQSIQVAFHGHKTDSPKVPRGEESLLPGALICPGS